MWIYKNVYQLVTVATSRPYQNSRIKMVNIFSLLDKQLLFFLTHTTSEPLQNYSALTYQKFQEISKLKRRLWLIKNWVGLLGPRRSSCTGGAEIKESTRVIWDSRLTPIWTCFFDRIDAQDSSLKSSLLKLWNELSCVSIRSINHVQKGDKRESRVFPLSPPPL